MLDRPARMRELPHRLRDRRRNRVLVSWNLPGGRAADSDRPDVAVRRVVRCARRRATVLHETDGVTKLTNKLAFRDKAGRDHMTRAMAEPGAENGTGASLDMMEDILRSLLDTTATVSE